jgi:hypothetical protein
MLPKMNVPLLPYSCPYRLATVSQLLMSQIPAMTACLTVKLLLVLASAVILGSESHGTHDHILISDGSGSLQKIPLTNSSQSQSQSYVKTDGQSASLSWCQAPFWDSRPDFYLCQTVVGLLMWGALSDERTSLSFTIAADPCQRSYSWVRESESRKTHDHILLSQIRDTSNLEGQVPLFIYSRNKVAKLYPQALGSLFVASYGS